MKSLILTAQEARELDKLGGLTITKPIKPAPRYIEGANIVTAGGGEWYLESNTGNRLGSGDGVADMFAPPVQTEDAVFIREPWYRLKNPQGGESERVILAADSVVSEEQVSYKWSSPVSMPEAAARRFARVKSIGVAYGENVSPVWLIELEAVDKAAAEAEEIGSFTIGKCKYCGREWGVTLEGAREGGFPTQRTADAAATRLCDCAEAVANREPIVGVAMAVTRGICRYCGQIQEVGPHLSQAAADETASEVCNCPTARQERRVLEQVEDAYKRVQRLFGDEAESLGFKPVPDEAVGLLEKVVEMIARGPISYASLNVRGRCKAKFSITSKGKIKVSRSETRSCDLEEGE